MGQREVLDYLEQKRKESDDWYTVNQIKEALQISHPQKNGFSRLYQNINKLAVFGLIEWKQTNIWHNKRVFRGCVMRETRL